ncbi:MAG TPA: heme ABC transporter permease CcmC [Methylomirabilota bacterium]|jgi:heme exporter protein C|nr:heme ABC transporter permease CcmC [Methylomirabilota bacterium]
MPRGLGATAAALLLLGLGAALGYAPRDAVQGNVQRIMYLHVPAILTAYVAIAVVLAASIAYLGGRRAVWDRVAVAAAELAVCFIGLTLVTGSIWGKPTWGTWWTWDARLTSTAVLFVIYLGYLLLRSVVEDRERAATYAAVLGILGALDVPIIHFSVQWWRTLHQPATVLRPQAPTMDGAMLVALAVNVAAFLCTFAYLLSRRYRLLTLETEAATRAWQ